MGTRSLVGVMIGNKCRTIYVHWDGYLEGVGRELQAYNTQADVEDLLAEGDRSSLTDGFYRDRGDKGVEPKDYDSFDELFQAAKDCWAEWYYVFKDGVWHCGNTYGGSVLCKKLIPYDQATEEWAAEVAAEYDE